TFRKGHFYDGNFRYEELVRTREEESGLNASTFQEGVDIEMNCRTHSPRRMHLGSLTPNETSNIIKRERERRRLIRYIQVRQQSSENARIIREKVKAARKREVAKIKKRITDSIVRRMSRERSIFSPLKTTPDGIPASSVSRHRRKAIPENEERAARRHMEALERLRRERQARRARRMAAIERRKKAEHEANLRSRLQTGRIQMLKK
uniref:ALMS motif domain-containing protein n=1 Tax=Parascaris univalens TaxID=6257 RepID=A0A915BVN2_PARUN